jgi:hypothetical protein
MNPYLLSYKRQTIALIITAGLIKLVLGSIIELNNDEAYYWTYARHLQWNYFDHPPMVGIFIRLFTANLYFHHEFFMRLPGVVSAAACTWIIFKIGESLRDTRTGWIAACLYTASFYSSIIAGLLILPDTPQLFFWLMSVLLLMTIIKRQSSQLPVNGYLLLAGLTIGLSILSKIHGVFLWTGFLGYVLFDQRALLKNPYLYLAASITAIILVPSFLWTLNNHSGTYNYHSARVTFLHFHPESFGREILGEVLYSNPVNYVLLIMAIAQFRTQNKNAILLKWLSFPLIGTVLFISVFNDTLPHWSGPAYATLIPFTALYLRNRQYPREFLPPVIFALRLIVVALVICIGMIKYFPGSMGQQRLPEWGKNDITLDMSGWRQFSDSLQKKLPGSPPIDCIFTDYWFPGGHLDFYTGYQLNLPVRVVGSLADIHHFAWLNPGLPTLRTGQNAWYITISNFYHEPPKKLTEHFLQCSRTFTIPQLRSGSIVRYFYIYQLTNYLGGLPDNGIIQ